MGGTKTNLATLVGTTGSVRGYCEGEFMGRFQACRDENGNIGWQSVDAAGTVLGWLDRNGFYGDVFARGNVLTIF